MNIDLSNIETRGTLVSVYVNCVKKITSGFNIPPGGAIRAAKPSAAGMGDLTACAVASGVRRGADPLQQVHSPPLWDDGLSTCFHPTPPAPESQHQHITF